MMKKRVFVSSVIEGFSELRETARHAIIEAGGEPILVNEDFPSESVSPRNACLDGVASCDIYILIIGNRGGWKAPSGRLVVEEEYYEARDRKIPSLVFIQRIEKDEDAQRFIKDISDYINGLFRREFTDTKELHVEIVEALKPLLIKGVDLRMIENNELLELDSVHSIYNETNMRVSLLPEREEEVISPQQIEDLEFVNLVYRIGHSSETKLFDYRRGKDRIIKENSLVIHQEESDSRNEDIRDIRIEIEECGKVIVDMNITGKRTGNKMDSYFYIIVEDIVDALTSAFNFISEFYNRIDPYKRHSRFYYNVALSNMRLLQNSFIF